MQVQRIQNNNMAFGAKINLIGTRFDESVLSTLSEKAKKIGYENDVVELKFSKFYSILDRNNYFNIQDKKHVNNMFTVFRQLFSARFLPNSKGRGIEHADERLFAVETPHDILTQQERVANNYLNNLVKKYGN